MVDPHDEDDLFKHTSMTFGEHLEELRSALFKAIIALAVGTCAGLYFGSDIVRLIEEPLKGALGTFYQNEAMEFVNARVPAELQNNEAIKHLVYDVGLLPEERYISPAEMLDKLKTAYPQTFDDVKLAPPTKPQEAASAQPPEQAAKTPDNVAKTSDQVAATSDQVVGTSDQAAATASALRGEHFNFDKMVRLFVWRPMAEDERLKLDALGVQEPFVIWMKAGFLLGAVISSPFVFYFLWQFVAAGLYPHEKRYIHVFLPFSLGLFLCGALLAFFFVFPPVLNFFFGVAKSLGSEMRPRLSEWLSFVLLLPLGFGISFQLPLVMLFLERIHVFSVATYLAKWRVAVLVIAIVAMVLSPGGDPYSMLMMLFPLVALYFGGIGLCRWMPQRAKPAVDRN